MEPGAGFLDLRAALSLDGALVRGEAGWRPYPWLATYAYGEASQSYRGPRRASLGLGARAVW